MAQWRNTHQGPIPHESRPFFFLCLFQSCSSRLNCSSSMALILRRAKRQDRTETKLFVHHRQAFVCFLLCIITYCSAVAGATAVPESTRMMLAPASRWNKLL